MMTLQAIKYAPGDLRILDQLKLPLESEYVRVQTIQEGWDVINKMQVRGAPAIGIVGCLTLAVDLRQREFRSTEDLASAANDTMRFLVTSRPTAVNLLDSALKIEKKLKKQLTENVAVEEAKAELLEWLESQLEMDVALNRRLAEHCADDILTRCPDRNVTVMTICNTGSLATAGYGTALGVVRNLHERGRLEHVYSLETRPYNQGARLTAYEIVHDGLPGTLITDSMAAALMARTKVDAVVVGADRIVSNGDFANKIGTYQLAIVAQHHMVPFYVVAPSTSFDFRLRTGADIVIEERAEDEVACIRGVRIAAPGIKVWNPAFDVTPAQLITGGVGSEFGLFTPQDLESKMKRLLEE